MKVVKSIVAALSAGSLAGVFSAQADGAMACVVEAGGCVTNYTYDARGHLAGVSGDVMAFGDDSYGQVAGPAGLPVPAVAIAASGG